MKTFDVVILGGGPAGTTAAIALSNHGVKNILILESGDYSKFVIGESIPPETKVVFNKLGIYNDFLAENHLPCHGTCSYWGDDRKGFSDTILSPFGHGWHLDRRRFNLFLSRKATDFGAQLEINAKFSRSHFENGAHTVEYIQNEEKQLVSAKFVIDATGKKFAFAQQNGSREKKSQSLLCLTRRYSLNDVDSVSSLTQIEAAEYGWWYGAELPNNELLIALYSDKETVREYQIQQVDVWDELIQATTSIKEGVFDSNPIDEKINGFSVKSSCLNKVVGKQWLAIGDAASTYDPITSRGIYKSITDAVFASNLIAKSFSDPSTDFNEFEVYVQMNYLNYLQERAHFYSIEQRWPQSPFWSKFHQLETPITSMLHELSA